MKNLIVIFILIFAFIAGCGDGGSDTPNPITQNEPAPSKLFDNPMVKITQTFDVKNIMGELGNLTESNFVAAHKKMRKMQLSGFPELNATFDLNSSFVSVASLKTKNYNAKEIYKNTWSRKDEYKCTQGGTVSKEVDLTPRGHLDADTYMKGDDTKYAYSQCDRGNETYNGSVTYHVNDFTKFDYTFGAIALGTFDSRFNQMSTGTDTQKITLNGTIRYTAKAQYKPEPDGSLISLETKYETVGDFVVTVYDKSTSETTKLTYNGTLEKVVYSKASSSDANATSIEGALGGFIYRKNTSYTLDVEQDGKMLIVFMLDNIPGVLDENGQLHERPVGYDSDNLSVMNVSLDSIYHMILANGTSRYIFDNNADFFPDADVTEGEPTHTLPPSDVDLMGDIVVIGFDTCPPTTKLRASLDALGLPYTYVNIHATQKERAVFDWFNVSGVPYVGIKGSYFGGGYHTDKRNLEILLNLYGFDMNDTVVKDKPIKSVSMKLEGWLETLQSKDKHTALAIAIDTPYLHQAAWVWRRNSKEEARVSALKDCEQLRSERVSKGKKPVRSPCEIYSLDGIKQ